MARVPLVPPSSLPEWLGRGRDYNVFRAVGNHPAVLSGLLSFMGPVYWGNSLAPSERELAWLTASRVNDCHY